ncbi:regulatory protein GemA [Amaricoccus sp.]|uniref:regulatory protein GemA n=1 Tax=Amaricoccus sp. TaxID=1872485 RepID=UPI0025BC66E4|nr:regulatory protein GemA [Amaricoccus sp.]
MSARNLQRLVHVGCRQLGIDAELRHDIQLAATGKASMAEMDEAELKLVVGALESRGFKPGFKGASKGGRAPAPRADLRYAHVLWGLLAAKGAVRAPGRDGLNAFVAKRFGKAWGATPIDVDALRDWRQIADLVDALKAWCKREGIPTTQGESSK